MLRALAIIAVGSSVWAAHSTPARAGNLRTAPLRRLASSTPQGGTCSGNAACASGVCRGGKCCVATFDNRTKAQCAACSDAGKCQSCLTHHDLVADACVLQQYGTCSVDAHCASQVCKGGHCCDGGNETTSNTCKGCFAKGTALQGGCSLKTVGVCTNDNQCESGTCLGLQCCVGTPTPGCTGCDSQGACDSCLPTRHFFINTSALVPVPSCNLQVVGGACASNADCASGACSQESGAQGTLGECWLTARPAGCNKWDGIRGICLVCGTGYVDVVVDGRNTCKFQNPHEPTPAPTLSPTPKPTPKPESQVVTGSCRLPSGGEDSGLCVSGDCRGGNCCHNLPGTGSEQCQRCNILDGGCVGCTSGFEVDSSGACVPTTLHPTPAPTPAPTANLTGVCTLDSQCESKKCRGGFCCQGPGALEGCAACWEKDGTCKTCTDNSYQMSSSLSQCFKVKEDGERCTLPQECRSNGCKGPVGEQRCCGPKGVSNLCQWCNYDGTCKECVAGATMLRETLAEAQARLRASTNNSKYEAKEADRHLTYECVLATKSPTQVPTPPPTPAPTPQPKDLGACAQSSDCTSNKCGLNNQCCKAGVQLECARCDGTDGHCTGCSSGWVYNSTTRTCSFPTIAPTPAPTVAPTNVPTRAPTKIAVGLCGQDSDCQSGKCRPGLNTTNKYCCGTKGLVFGCVRCDYNGDCAQCSGGPYQPPPEDPKTCRRVTAAPTPAPFIVCNYEAGETDICAGGRPTCSGYNIIGCNPVRPVLHDVGACTKDAECTSGVCRGGSCCTSAYGGTSDGCMQCDRLTGACAACVPGKELDPLFDSTLSANRQGSSGAAACEPRYVNGAFEMPLATETVQKYTCSGPNPNNPEVVNKCLEDFECGPNVKCNTNGGTTAVQITYAQKCGCGVTSGSSTKCEQGQIEICRSGRPHCTGNDIVGCVPAPPPTPPPTPEPLLTGNCAPDRELRGVFISDCSSGFCRDGGCCASSVTGSRCHSCDPAEGDCTNCTVGWQLVNSGGTRTCEQHSIGVCLKNEQCYSGTCKAGNCCVSDHPSVASYCLQCGADGECSRCQDGFELRRLGGANSHFTCQPIVRVSGSCIVDGQCYSNICRNSQCVKALGTCSAGDECVSGFCRGGNCCNAQGSKPGCTACFPSTAAIGVAGSCRSCSSQFKEVAGECALVYPPKCKVEAGEIANCTNITSGVTVLGDACDQHGPLFVGCLTTPRPTPSPTPAPPIAPLSCPENNTKVCRDGRPPHGCAENEKECKPVVTCNATLNEISICPPYSAPCNDTTSCQFYTDANFSAVNGCAIGCQIPVPTPAPTPSVIGTTCERDFDCGVGGRCKGNFCCTGTGLDDYCAACINGTGACKACVSNTVGITISTSSFTNALKCVPATPAPTPFPTPFFNPLARPSCKSADLTPGFEKAEIDVCTGPYTGRPYCEDKFKECTPVVKCPNTTTHTPRCPMGLPTCANASDCVFVSDMTKNDNRTNHTALVQFFANFGCAVACDARTAYPTPAPTTFPTPLPTPAPTPAKGAYLAGRCTEANATKDCASGICRQGGCCIVSQGVNYGNNCRKCDELTGKCVACIPGFNIINEDPVRQVGRCSLNTPPPTPALVTCDHTGCPHDCAEEEICKDGGKFCLPTEVIGCRTGNNRLYTPRPTPAPTPVQNIFGRCNYDSSLCKVDATAGTPGVCKGLGCCGPRAAQDPGCTVCSDKINSLTNLGGSCLQCAPGYTLRNSTGDPGYDSYCERGSPTPSPTPGPTPAPTPFVSCNSLNGRWLGQETLPFMKVSLELDTSVAAGEASLTLQGPADRWLGIGLGAQKMADAPNAIIVLPDGSIVERKLANYKPGTEIATQVQKVSDVVSNNVRTIVLKRAFAGQTAEHYTFEDPLSIQAIPFIGAIGRSEQGNAFGYHEKSAPATINLAKAENYIEMCTIGVCDLKASPPKRATKPCAEDSTKALAACDEGHRKCVPKLNCTTFEDPICPHHNCGHQQCTADCAIACKPKPPTPPPTPPTPAPTPSVAELFDAGWACKFNTDCRQGKCLPARGKENNVCAAMSAEKAAGCQVLDEKGWCAQCNLAFGFVEMVLPNCVPSDRQGSCIVCDNTPTASPTPAPTSFPTPFPTPAPSPLPTAQRAPREVTMTVRIVLINVFATSLAGVDPKNPTNDEVLAQRMLISVLRVLLGDTMDSISIVPGSIESWSAAPVISSTEPLVNNFNRRGRRLGDGSSSNAGAIAARRRRLDESGCQVDVKITYSDAAKADAADAVINKDDFMSNVQQQLVNPDANNALFDTYRDSSGAKSVFQRMDASSSTVLYANRDDQANGVAKKVPPPAPAADSSGVIVSAVVGTGIIALGVFGIVVFKKAKDREFEMIMAAQREGAFNKPAMSIRDDGEWKSGGHIGDHDALLEEDDEDEDLDLMDSMPASDAYKEGSLDSMRGSKHRGSKQGSKRSSKRGNDGGGGGGGGAGRRMEMGKSRGSAFGFGGGSSHSSSRQSKSRPGGGSAAGAFGSSFGFKSQHVSSSRGATAGGGGDRKTQSMHSSRDKKGRGATGSSRHTSSRRPPPSSPSSGSARQGQASSNKGRRGSALVPKKRASLVANAGAAEDDFFDETPPSPGRGGHRREKSKTRHSIKEEMDNPLHVV